VLERKRGWCVVGVAGKGRELTENEGKLRAGVGQEEHGKGEEVRERER